MALVVLAFSFIKQLWSFIVLGCEEFAINSIHSASTFQDDLRDSAEHLFKLLQPQDAFLILVAIEKNYSLNK